jgi:glutamate---cysteine ligase / carboxylate-amine ligase
MSVPSDEGAFHLFDGVGVEVEYALVDVDTLEVRPLADRLLLDADGQPTSELEFPETCWSNELSAHVLEVKSNGPATDLEKFRAALAGDVQSIAERLRPLGAMPMPTAMHPLMVPATDARLWPHGHSDIYRTYDRIFDCRGHGWSNLQSMHLNLPFAGDEEFRALHAAIRVTLPLLPALAASSPFQEATPTGSLDTRLVHYRNNQSRLPIITGAVIPEPVCSEAAYRRLILDPIAEAVAPLDPDGVLDAEWVNSRGAIARFSRGSIEIRVLDTQECPGRDLTIAALVVATVRALCEERLSSRSAQEAWSVERLAPIFWSGVEQGGHFSIDDPLYATLFGLPAEPIPVGRLWEYLATELAPPWARESARALVREGCLASRILRFTGPEPRREVIVEIYRELCRCLAEDRPLST